MGVVRGSYIPKREIHILRELTRYRYKLTCMRSSEKNRYQNAFTVYNCNLDAVVSYMSGKLALDIEDYLINITSEGFDPYHCAELLRKCLKKKPSHIIASIEGFQISVEPKERVKIIK